MSSVKMEICTCGTYEERGGDEPPEVEPDEFIRSHMPSQSMTEKLAPTKHRTN